MRIDKNYKIDVVTDYATDSMGLKVYKKVCSIDTGEKLVATLLVPFDNQLVHLGRGTLWQKCRCETALVLDIKPVEGRKVYDEAVSEWDSRFKYKVGKWVEVKRFGTQRDPCKAGIHFFFSKDDAIAYN